MPTYESARLKIKRANKHIEDFELSVNMLKERLVVGAHVNADRGNEFVKCDFASTELRDAFENLPAILGDAIHNLKCALDHAWFGTIRRLSPSAKLGKTQFPSHPKRDGLETKLRDLQIDVAIPNLFTLILDHIKPYDGGDDFFIRTIHKLDRRDKHTLLIPVVSYSSISEIYVEDQSGRVHRGGTWGTTDPFPHFVEFIRGLHIKNPGSSSFEVMFEYGDVGKQARGVDTLRLYSHSVSLVIEQLETLL